MIAEALASGIELTDVFSDTDDAGLAPLLERCEAAGASVVQVADNVLRAVATTATPQGVVAVARLPRFSLEQLPEEADLVLVLAEVRDPGNAGALVRTAAAAGADCAVFTRGSTDPFGAKTVRSSVGAVFKLPIARAVDTDEAVSALKAGGFRVLGAEGAAPLSVYDLDLTKKTAIMLGNEAWGFDRPDLPVDEWASIPLDEKVESLNVATAGAIFLFETVRQRRLSSARHG